MLTSRIEQMLNKSVEVLADCALPNGAIVAANATSPDYPSTAENYHFSWGRDTAYQLVAGNVLGMPGAADIRQRYLGWLVTRAQGFKQSGLLVKRLSPNGAYDHRYGDHYQPDQAGALLWALDEVVPGQDKLVDEVTIKLANGLCNTWQETHFNGVTQDLWENRMTDPAKGDVFTYSLASTLHGLTRAVERLGDHPEAPTENWEQTATQMRQVLIKPGGEFFGRMLPQPSSPSESLDASLLALVHPFSDLQLMATSTGSSKVRRTVEAINTNLYTPGDGVLRYEGDTYDGIVRLDGGEQVAGRWPLLGFWHAIALKRLGEGDGAQAVYDGLIDALEARYALRDIPYNVIPEQLFEDHERQRQVVMPLAWSHAMFALATHELGIH